MIWALLAAAHAADVPAAAAAVGQDTPALLEARARRVERKHMLILGSWSVINLGVGTVGVFTAEEPRIRSFHGTNAAWNTVNAALAVVGLLGGRNRDVSSFDAVRERHRKLQKALVLNIGFDGLYIASGLATALVGDALDKPAFRGTGESLMLQGGFLLVFDLLFLDAHRRADKPTEIALLPTRNGLRVVGRF